MNLRASSPPPRPKAFTIVEILLAMGIFSMVLVSVYSAWSAIIRGTKSAQAAAADVQRCRVAVRAVEQAIQNVQIYAGNADWYTFTADTAGDYAALILTSRLPESFPGSGLYGEQQRLRYVKFFVYNDSNSRRFLILRQWPLLSPPPTSSYRDPDDAYDIELGHDVDLFKLDFFDATKKDWVDEWKQTNAFPALVRVSIGMGNKPGTPEDKRAIITRVIAPATIVVPVDYQGPGLRSPQAGRGLNTQPGMNPNDPMMMPGGFNPNDPRMLPGGFTPGIRR